MDNSWLEHPSLKKMDPRKKQILLNIQKETKGKPLNQCYPYIMKANNTLHSQGLSFTPDESALMIQMLTSDMSPQDLAKFEMMRNMMGNMNKNKGKNMDPNMKPNMNGTKKQK